MCERACLPAIHEEIKADPMRWPTYDLCGHSHSEAFDNEPAEWLEHRNCSCGSTMSKAFLHDPRTT